MKYPRYPAYRDSGVEWIGEIPEHWEVRKLKHLSTIEMGQSPRSDDYIDNGKVPFIQGSAEFGNIHPLNIHYCDKAKKFAHANDILLSVRAPVGDLNIADKDYGIGRGLCAIRPNDCYRDFIYLYLNSSNNYLLSISSGSTYDSISVDDVGNIPISIPRDKDESIKISCYLNLQSSKIDALVKRLQKMIKLLQEKRQAIITHAVTKGLDPNVPMKDSGVEWIGKIPEHWDIAKLNRVCHFKYGSSLSAEYRTPGKYPVFGSNGIIGYNKQINTKSPVIIIGRKGSFGKVTYSTTPGFAIDTTFFVDESILEVNLKWLFYVLGTLDLDSISKDTGVPGLSREDAYKKVLPLPPLKEQIKISSFLEYKVDKINTLILKLQKMTNLLNEYRSSLISSAVTGKIDVRNIPLNESLRPQLNDR